MKCERAAGPGRVKCTVDVRAPASRTIAWADVVIVDVPEFTTALKGRLGPGDATSREPGRQAWAFGLVAKRVGQGEARASVRLVLCEGADASSRCAPLIVDVRAEVVVGS